MILLLIEWGLICQPLLYLSAFFEAHRQDYYNRWLVVSQRGQWKKWLLFFFKGVSNQSLDAITRIKRLRQLRPTYRERLRSEQAAARFLLTLDILFERTILNIRQLEVALNIPYRTAQRYIEKLVKLGILTEVMGRARNCLYQADEVLQELERR